MKNFVKFMALCMVMVFALSFAAVAEPVEDEAAVVEETETAEPVAEEPVAEEPAGEGEAVPDESNTSSDYMYELLIDVKLDGSFDLTLMQPMGEYIDSIDSYVDSYKSNFEPEGFSVEKNEAGDTIVINKTYEDTPASISLPGDSVEAHQFAVKKGWFCDTYFLTDRTFDMSSYPAGENYFKIKITTPFPAVYSNAMLTENFGRTNTFGIKTGFANPVTMIYKIYKPIPIACLAMIIILLVVFVFVMRSNKKKKYLEEFEMIDSEDGYFEALGEEVADEFEEVVEDAAEEASEIAETAEEAALDTVEDVAETIEEAVEEVTEEDEDK